MAKDLVRVRGNIKRFYEMIAQISAISLRLQTLKSSHDISAAMSSATKLMRSCNQKMNLPEMQKIVANFERNSDIMDMKGELINDTIDVALGEQDDEQETELIVNQVLDEIGLSLNQTVRRDNIFYYSFR